jgi:DHA2 family multidrug resistance protein
MNVPMGILSLVLVSRLVEDPAYLTEQIKKARAHLSLDYIGIGVLALCLGSLQVVLDKGQEDNWFHSPLIATLAVIFPVALVLFVIWELMRSKPMMDLRLFKNRNFAGAAAMMFVLGVQVYAVTVFVPQFVQGFLGYNAGLAGLTQMPQGLVLLIMFPIAGMLVGRISARWLIALGFLLCAFATYRMTSIDLQIDFRTAAMYKVWQGFGLALLFVPINTVSYVGLPEEKGGEVSGIINLLRNLGGSVGISLVQTMIARRSQFHQDELVSHVTRARQSYRSATDGLNAQLSNGGLSQPQAARQTTLRIYNSVITQATVLSYIDVAWLLAVVALVMVPLALLLKKNDPKAAPVGE